MGYPRKKTPEMLDRIVQIIWHFKHLHGETETPSTSLIANELGITASGIGPYITKLEEAGRVDRIQLRPMRVTLLDHPMNKRAIKLFQRELEKAHKPLDIRKPEPEPKAQPPEQMSPPTVAEIPAAPPTSRPAPGLPFPRPKSLWEAEQNLKAVGVDPATVVGRDVITLPTIKTAPTGLLLEELIERGYCVSKAR